MVCIQTQGANISSLSLRHHVMKSCMFSKMISRGGLEISDN